jgi:hypothetical protein
MWFGYLSGPLFTNIHSRVKDKKLKQSTAPWFTWEPHFIPGCMAGFMGHNGTFPKPAFHVQRVTCCRSGPAPASSLHPGLHFRRRSLTLALCLQLPRLTTVLRDGWLGTFEVTEGDTFGIFFGALPWRGWLPASSSLTMPFQFGWPLSVGRYERG